MVTPPIAGLDLSLTATGLADRDDALHVVGSRLRGLERLAELRDTILATIGQVPQPDLVVVEGYAYGRPNQAHQLGELGGVIRLALHEAGHTIVNVPPKSLKLFATGKGNANKDEVLSAAVRRWPDIDNNNAADAAWLRAMGQAAYLDDPETLTMTQAKALQAIDWPVL